MSGFSTITDNNKENNKNAIHQFAEMMKAITDYVGQEYTHGGDIRFMVENL